MRAPQSDIRLVADLGQAGANAHASRRTFRHATVPGLAQVTAPSFLLGAVAAFISVLIARMNRIIDRSQALNAISDDDVSRASE